MDVEPGSSAAPGAAPRPSQRVSSVQLHVHEEKEIYTVLVGVDHPCDHHRGRGRARWRVGGKPQQLLTHNNSSRLQSSGVFTKNSPFCLMPRLMRESGSIQIQAEDSGRIVDETRNP